MNNPINHASQDFSNESEREAAFRPTPSRPSITLESLHALMVQILEAVKAFPRERPTLSDRTGSSLAPTGPVPDPLVPVHKSLDDHWAALGVTASAKPAGPSTQALWEVAKYLGDHYDILAPWYRTIKRSVQHGQLARLTLQDESRLTIDTICRLNRLLYKFGLATHVNYTKYPIRRFVLTPNSHPHTVPFLLGGWLEDYVAYQVAVATGCGTLARNLLIQATPSQQLELDLVWYHPPIFLIMECKTNDYQASLPRLHLISQHLRPTHLYVVVLQRPYPDVVQQFSHAYGIRLVSLPDLPRTMSHLVASVPGLSPPDKSVQSMH